MMEAVWIAFACGIFIGLVLGVLFLGLVSINKENKWKSELTDSLERVSDVELQRQLLKEEIFRLSKNYKPRKPQPRLRRNMKKNNRKK